jgi:DNA-binding IclR family transcriptional regulator
MNDRPKTVSKRYSSPAVEQASQVLFCLAGARSSHMSLIQICSEVGIGKSKAFCILEALQKFRLVQRNSDGKGYALGPGLVSLSRKVLDDLSPPRLAEPVLRDLARKTGSTAILGLIADEDVFIAGKCEGDGDIGVTTRIGWRMPITYGAHGIAIAAFLGKKERERLLRRKDLRFYGDPAKLERGQLRKDLASCRKTGFTEDLGVARQGLNVVSAPVLGPSGTPIGYIELLVLFSADTAHRFGPLVGEAGRSLSRQLGADVEEVWAKVARPAITTTREQEKPHRTKAVRRANEA